LHAGRLIEELKDKAMSLLRDFHPLQQDLNPIPSRQFKDGLQQASARNQTPFISGLHR